MWPFPKREQPAVDQLTLEVDLGPLGPFHETERYLLVWRNGLAQSNGLTVVYEGRHGDRVHVVHSPGYDHGAGMETHGEWVGTEVRRRDPSAVALFLVWPRDLSAIGDPKAELIRVWFTPNPAGVASPTRTILMSDGEDGPPLVENIFTKPAECLYEDMRYGHPRRSPDFWADVLGCPVPTFTTAEWVGAADHVDPGRVQRAGVEKAEQDDFEGHDMQRRTQDGALAGVLSRQTAGALLDGLEAHQLRRQAQSAGAALEDRREERDTEAVGDQAGEFQGQVRLVGPDRAQEHHRGPGEGPGGDVLAEVTKERIGLEQPRPAGQAAQAVALPAQGQQPAREEQE